MATRPSRDPTGTIRERTGRLFRVVVSCAVGLMLVVPLVSPPAALAEKQRTRRVARGVVHKVIRYGAVPRVVHVVIADVSGPVSLKVGLATGILPGAERVSSMARRHGAVAAINGDFFRPSGRPVAAFAVNRRLVQTPLAWSANIAFGRGGASAFIGHQDVAVRLASRFSGAKRRVARVNMGRPRRKRIHLYTRQGGRLTRPPKDACAARLARSGPFTVDPKSSTVSANYRVGKVACRYHRMALKDGMVIASRRGGPGRDYIKGLRSHRRQRLEWSLGWPRVAETLGGNPVLVKDGEIAWHNLRGVHSPLFEPHPRTGIGLRKDGKIMFVTVDGRRPKYSRGISMVGFAKLMHSLGAEWALNLDGGGSTTMVVGGKVVNRPSDGRQRAVGSALLLVRDGDKRQASALPDDDDDEEDDLLSDARSIIETRVSIATAEQDPASVGGLSSWLMSEGRMLPPSLRGVASRFDAARFLGRGDR